MVSKEFEKATIEVEQINGTLNNDEMLDVSFVPTFTAAFSACRLRSLLLRTVASICPTTENAPADSC